MRVQLDHLQPTNVGTTVVAEATLERSRAAASRSRCRSPTRRAGGRGPRHRVIVDLDRFLEKAAMRRPRGRDRRPARGRRRARRPQRVQQRRRRLVVGDDLVHRARRHHRPATTLVTVATTPIPRPGATTTPSTPRCVRQPRHDGTTTTVASTVATTTIPPGPTTTSGAAATTTTTTATGPVPACDRRPSSPPPRDLRPAAVRATLDTPMRGPGASASSPHPVGQCLRRLRGEPGPLAGRQPRHRPACARPPACRAYAGAATPLALPRLGGVDRQLDPTPRFTLVEVVGRPGRA